MREGKIISALYGLAGAVVNGRKTENTDIIFIKNLAAAVTEDDFDEAFAERAAREITEEKYRVSPGCATCEMPCGNTSDLDMDVLYSRPAGIRELKAKIINRAEKLAAKVVKNKAGFSEKHTDLLYRAVAYIGYDLDRDFLNDFLREIKDSFDYPREDVMIRKIIKIDTDKCNGCGACADACHEGAIRIKEGKAVLTREDYCDGLGDCLPACPADAISFEYREAPAYDELAVAASKKENSSSAPQVLPVPDGGIKIGDVPSQLAQWPCQIKLAPVTAPFYSGADLLVSADCAAYTCATFHRDYMRGKITLIGCPKLDGVDYSEKLGRILKSNDIKSVTLVRMEVPCCGGLENAVKQAVKNCGKPLSYSVITLSIKGKVLDGYKASPLF